MSLVDDDLPPDLEDMTEFVQQQRQKRTAAASSSSSSSSSSASKSTTTTSSTSTEAPASDTKPPATSISTSTSTSTSTNTSTIKSAPRKSNEGAGMFGGLKGGFFNKPTATTPSTTPTQPSTPSTSTSTSTKTSTKTSTSTSTTPSTSTSDDIPFIKPQAQTKQKDNLVLPEVTEAMNAAKGLKPETWLTPDFMTRLQSDPQLLQQLMNPKITAAMGEISKNPKAALEKYKSDAELGAFIKLFMGFMGQHFTSLADQQEKSSDSASSSSSSSSSTSASTSPSSSLPTSTSDMRQVSTRVTNASPSTSTSTSSTPSSSQPRQVSPRTMQRWLADPQIRDVLNDPRTSMMLEEIKNDRTKFKQYVSLPSIRLLIRAGILEAPPEYAHMV